MEHSGQKEILKNLVAEWKKMEFSIGFVPTMGALHQGHLDLVEEARRHCTKVVVSIFINPLQFNNPDDLNRYPRQPESDVGLLKNAGVDFLYMPEASDFYELPTRISMDFGTTGNHLEGLMRPGHFSGVGIVLARLFHLVEPDKAFFGAKDLQQVAVVKTLVRDLEFPLEIVRCPTRREPGGLAMSSRNQRLSSTGRKTAEFLFQALQIAASSFGGNPEAGLKEARNFIVSNPEITLEYLEWVDAENMEIWNGRMPAPKETAICIAAMVEGVRLIDNLIVSF